MPREAKVKCTCKYKCSRFLIGYDFVSSKSRARHLRLDEIGKLCAAKLIVERGQSHGGPSKDIPGSSASIPTHQGVQASTQRQWRYRPRAPLYRALLGSRNNEYSADGDDDDVVTTALPDFMDVDSNGMPPQTQYGIHILP